MPNQDREQPRHDRDPGEAEAHPAPGGNGRGGRSPLEADEAPAGFTGGEDLSRREEFAGRPNVTEEREHHATRPEEEAGNAEDPTR